MIYCWKCDHPTEPCFWVDAYRLCPEHGYERNSNGTMKSTLSPEQKREIVAIKERARTKKIQNETKE